MLRKKTVKNIKNSDANKDEMQNHNHDNLRIIYHTLKEMGINKEGIYISKASKKLSFRNVDSLKEYLKNKTIDPIKLIRLIKEVVILERYLMGKIEFYSETKKYLESCEKDEKRINELEKVNKLENIANNYLKEIRKDEEDFCTWLDELDADIVNDPNQKKNNSHITKERKKRKRSDNEENTSNHDKMEAPAQKKHKTDQLNDRSAPIIISTLNSFDILDLTSGKIKKSDFLSSEEYFYFDNPNLFSTQAERNDTIIIDKILYYNGRKMISKSEIINLNQLKSRDKIIVYGQEIMQDTFVRHRKFILSDTDNKQPLTINVLKTVEIIDQIPYLTVTETVNEKEHKKKIELIPLSNNYGHNPFYQKRYTIKEYSSSDETNQYQEKSINISELNDYDEIKLKFGTIRKFSFVSRKDCFFSYDVNIFLNKTQLENTIIINGIPYFENKKVLFLFEIIKLNDVDCPDTFILYGKSTNRENVLSGKYLFPGTNQTLTRDQLKLKWVEIIGERIFFGQVGENNSKITNVKKIELVPQSTYVIIDQINYDLFRPEIPKMNSSQGNNNNNTESDEIIILPPEKKIKWETQVTIDNNNLKFRYFILKDYRIPGQWKKLDPEDLKLAIIENNKAYFDIIEKRNGKTEIKRVELIHYDEVIHLSDKTNTIQDVKLDISQSKSAQNQNKDSSTIRIVPPLKQMRGDEQISIYYGAPILFRAFTTRKKCKIHGHEEYLTSDQLKCAFIENDTPYLILLKQNEGVKYLEKVSIISSDHDREKKKFESAQIDTTQSSLDILDNDQWEKIFKNKNDVKMKIARPVKCITNTTRVTLYNNSDLEFRFFIKKKFTLPGQTKELTRKELRFVYFIDNIPYLDIIEKINNQKRFKTVEILPLEDYGQTKFKKEQERKRKSKDPTYPKLTHDLKIVITDDKIKQTDYVQVYNIELQFHSFTSIRKYTIPGLKRNLTQTELSCVIIKNQRAYLKIVEQIDGENFVKKVELIPSNPEHDYNQRAFNELEKSKNELKNVGFASNTNVVNNDFGSIDKSIDIDDPMIFDVIAPEFNLGSNQICIKEGDLYSDNIEDNTDINKLILDEKRKNQHDLDKTNLSNRTNSINTTFINDNNLIDANNSSSTKPFNPNNKIYGLNNSNIFFNEHHSFGNNNGNGNENNNRNISNKKTKK